MTSNDLKLALFCCFQKLWLLVIGILTLQISPPWIFPSLPWPHCHDFLECEKKKHSFFSVCADEKQGHVIEILKHVNSKSARSFGLSLQEMELCKVDIFLYIWNIYVSLFRLEIVTILFFIFLLISSVAIHSYLFKT